jgi:hypothetical protein
VDSLERAVDQMHNAALATAERFTGTAQSNQTKIVIADERLSAKGAGGAKHTGSKPIYDKDGKIAGSMSFVNGKMVCENQSGEIMDCASYRTTPIDQTQKYAKSVEGGETRELISELHALESEFPPNPANRPRMQQIKDELARRRALGGKASGNTKPITQGSPAPTVTFDKFLQ